MELVIAESERCEEECEILGYRIVGGGGSGGGGGGGGGVFERR